MSKESLSAKAVQHAAPREKRYEIPAGDGLYLIVFPSGVKSWCVRYRWRGISRKLTLEKGYPELGLAAARAEAEAKLQALDEDKDPAAVQAKEIEESTPESVRAVCEEWIKRHVKVHTKERTQDEFDRIMRKEVLPHWKGKFITEIARPDVLRTLDFLCDRKTPALANKTLAVMKSFFSWCVERGYIDYSPAHKLKPPARNKSRERVLEEGELAEVWRAANEMEYPANPFLRCLILTGQRRGEVAGMRWRDLDLDRGLWAIPAEFMKSKRIHVVPLSVPVLAILKDKEFPRFAKGDFVFTTTAGAKAINGFTKLKNRIDEKTLEARKSYEIKTNIPEWDIHDIRRTMTTVMAESGVLPHVLSAVLGHSAAASVSVMPSAAVTRIYNRYAYLEEKRAALEAWAQHVLHLVEEKTATATA